MSGFSTAAGLLASRCLVSPLQHQTVASQTLLQYTAVRFRRKPRWLGTAKSKLFRVPERRQQIEEERVELMRLHNNYHTQMKAVRRFLIDEVEAFKLVSRAGMVIQTPEEAEAEWKEVQRINEEWNRSVAEVREKRLAEEREQRKTFILERLVAKEARDQERQERVEARVRAEKEQGKTFITRDNIDQAIERALVQPTSYNFAIDSNGNLHRQDDEVQSQEAKSP
ncbi:mitochondrial ribosomal protein S26 [Culex quinquefasciatus]|uniref:Small ribosomal subunit protein mS26 n=1 Tax=Culex quinquefasciatus TaxID=7176 RepID=B0WKP0_CULQU|nr:mitochondrial ribosomal protein S26 [Culex quinquefasciatus]|eukprot:XP_001849274.1 mitochondrial ribosomal protein S26 [Culex quinquefasciatus]